MSYYIANRFNPLHRVGTTETIDAAVYFALKKAKENRIDMVVTEKGEGTIRGWVLAGRWYYPVECPDCEGEGMCADEDRFGNLIDVFCSACEGRGLVPEDA